MLLQAAVPLIRDNKLSLEIIGDGPQMPHLKQIAEQQNIEDAVSFTGWIDHTQLHNRLTQHDIFAFPSIREFGGGVVLEAMAMGLVPVIADYAGPAELVTKKTGFKVPMGTRDQLIDRFRQTLTSITDNPSILPSMSQAAQQRIQQHFTWQAKAKQVLNIYNWLLNPSLPKPDYPMPIPDSD